MRSSSHWGGRSGNWGFGEFLGQLCLLSLVAPEHAIDQPAAPVFMQQAAGVHGGREGCVVGDTGVF